MRLLFLFVLTSLASTLSAQPGGADPEEILRIRAEYNHLNAVKTDIQWKSFEDGLRVGMLNDKIRIIEEESQSGSSVSHYYWPDGTPFFTYTFSNTLENRYYYARKDGARAATTIRHIDESGTVRSNPGQSYSELASAYTFYDLGKGWLDFTPVIYESISDRLYLLDEKLNNRPLKIIDTIDHRLAERLEDDSVDEELGFDPCSDFTVRYSENGQFLATRTLRKHGCDVGCMVYTEFETVIDLSPNGDTLRKVEIETAHRPTEDDSGATGFTQDVFQTDTYWNGLKREYAIKTMTIGDLRIAKTLLALGF